MIEVMQEVEATLKSHSFKKVHSSKGQRVWSLGDNHLTKTALFARFSMLVVDKKINCAALIARKVKGDKTINSEITWAKSFCATRAKFPKLVLLLLAALVKRII